MNYSTSRVTLTLNRDGTFEQLFQKKGDAKVVRRAGRWELTDFEGPSVQLKGAVVVRNAEGAIESDDQAGGWILRIDRSFGHFRLIASEDQGFYFEKSRDSHPL